MSGEDANDAPIRPRLKVLIADDAFASRDLLARQLRLSLRAEIHEARDGRQALRQFSIVRPQITFLDIEMPGVDGMSVLKDIRAANPDALVVIVSGNGSLEMVKQALELGVGGFIVKPFSGQRVLDIVKKYAAQIGDETILRVD